MFNDLTGKTKDKDQIKTILENATNVHVKCELKCGEKVAYGMLNSIEDKQIIIFIKGCNKEDLKKCELFFFLSGYLFDFETAIQALEDNFFHFSFPPRLHYRRRDNRLEFSRSASSDDEEQPVFCDINNQSQCIIGKLLDLSKRGIGFKPETAFIDLKLKKNDTLSNVFFYLDESNIIIEESVIRNINNQTVGLEFTKITDFFKKKISDFIIIELRKRDEEEKQKFLREAFPERYRKQQENSEKLLFTTQVPSKDIPTVYDPKSYRVLVFDYNPNIYELIQHTYQTYYTREPDQGRINLIKNSPHILLTSLYPAKSNMDKLKWLNLINESKSRKVPIVIIFEQMLEKEKIIAALKMFGASDIIIRNIMTHKETVCERIDRLLKKIYQ